MTEKVVQGSSDCVGWGDLVTLLPLYFIIRMIYPPLTLFLLKRILKFVYD